MPSLVAITIDGVLADQSSTPDSFAASKFMIEGALAYKGFAAVGKLALISLQPPSDAFKVEHWLKGHGLREHMWVHYDPHPDDPDRGVPRVIHTLRSTGPLDLVVEGSPERAARFLHHGVTSLVMAKPPYNRGEFRPDSPSEARPWDAVVRELDEQAGLVQADERGTSDAVSEYAEG